MDFFFDTSLIFLALVVVLIITTITGIILVRDGARFALRRKKERAAETGEERAPLRAAAPVPVPAADPERVENGGTRHA